MAEITQSVKYEIRAEDLTGPAAESAAANVEKASKAEAEAKKKHDKAVADTKKEAQDANSLFGSVTAAIGGNFGALAAKIAEVGAQMKGVKVNALALGAIGAIVSSVTSVVKDLYEHWKRTKEKMEAIKLGNLLGEMDRLKSASEEVAAGIERQRQKAEAARDVINSQVEATRRLKDAQLEYAKAQELSLAKTDRERELIERKYKLMGRQNEREHAAARREMDMDAAKENVALLEKEMAAAKESERAAVRLANDYMRRSRELARPDGFFDMKHRGASGQRIEQQIELLGGKQDEAWGEAKAAARAQQELEVKIAAAKDKIKALKEQQRADEMTEEIADYGASEEDEAKRLAKKRKLYEAWQAAGGRGTMESFEDAQKKQEEKKLDEDRKKYVKYLEEMGEKAPELKDIGGKAFEEFQARLRREEEEAKKRELENVEEVVEAKIEGEQEVADAKKRLAAENAAYQQLKDDETAAQARLAAAKGAVAQAWGWYRNKDSMKAQLEEEKANAEAERQFEKDFAKLKFDRDWREAKNLSVDQEAVWRVALAKEEEQAAEKSLASIDQKMGEAVEALKKMTEEA